MRGSTVRKKKPNKGGSGRRGRAPGYLAKMALTPAASLTRTIRVQLFARYAELFGGEFVELPLEGIHTVADVLERLRALPGGEVFGSATLVAVNLRQARPALPVTTTDEIAILPPLAGG